MSDAEFLTSPDSPFPDGYDLIAERAWLISHGCPVDDPEWDPVDSEHIARILLYFDRKDALIALRKKVAARNSAEAVVPDELATQKPGRLIGSARMYLHTLQAQRLFHGRAEQFRTFPAGTTLEDVSSQLGVPVRQLSVVRDNENGVRVRRAGAIGVVRWGACLTRIFTLTGDDNPIADWFLIKFDRTIEQLRKSLKKRVRERKSQIDRSREMGYEIDVLRSNNPLMIPSTFGSPYGARVIELLLLADYVFRLNMTCDRYGLISKLEADHYSRDVMRFIRNEALKTEIAFSRMFKEDAPFSAITRKMVLEGWTVPDEHKDLMRKFGLDDIPAQVISGELKPNHFKRSSNNPPPVTEDVTKLDELIAAVEHPEELDLSQAVSEQESLLNDVQEDA